MTKFIFIHIGKCGGGSISKSLEEHGFEFSRLHLQEIKYINGNKYVISIRNPIYRFVSAFNWRTRIVCDGLGRSNQEYRFEGEKELLEKYKTVNNLAESLYKADGEIQNDLSLRENYIHHIKEDINFYIGNFLEECQNEDILGVITTETLSEDMKELFGTKRVPNEKKPTKKYSTYLSPLGYKNLAKYLQKDFDCVQALYHMNLISKSKYELLSENRFPKVLATHDYF